MDFKIKAKGLYLNANSILHAERAIDQRLSGCVALVEQVSLYLSKKKRFLERKVKQYQCHLIIELANGEYVRFCLKHDDLRFAIDEALRKAGELIKCRASESYAGKGDKGLVPEFGGNEERRVGVTEVAYTI